MSANTDPGLSSSDSENRRLPMLDGWRATSILLVLAGHMLPLGPAKWGINEAVAANGMAIFFVLSGFLIVSILERDEDVRSFLIRRVARIFPLAWLALAFALPLQQATPAQVAANALFYANLPPFRLLPWTSHFWSLDVEVQFYGTIALIVLAAGRRGLMIVPAAAAIVTALRISVGAETSIVTWLRLDEILAGGCLALAFHRSNRLSEQLVRLPFWPLAVLAALSTRPELPWLCYARPYLTALTIGITVVRPISGVSRILKSRPAGYLASVSYAVYVIHHFTMFGWFSSGGSTIKYLKRPIAFMLTFTIAHISTFRVERPINAWAHNLTSSRKGRSQRD